MAHMYLKSQGIHVLGLFENNPPAVDKHYLPLAKSSQHSKYAPLALAGPG